MIKGGMNTASHTQTAQGVQINNSAYGKAVRLIYGLTNTGPDLIWYNGWGSSDAPVNPRIGVITGVGEQSKKEDKKSNVRYYSCAVDFLLGHAPILGILNVWYLNHKLTVLHSSASGVINNGQYSFTPIGGDSKVEYRPEIPRSAPYQIQVEGFVANFDVKLASTKILFQEAAPDTVPGPYQYTVTNSGLYTFNQVDSGKQVIIRYYKQNISGSPGLLAGIYAAVIHEDFTATFTDFGNPNAVTQHGTWQRPLWHAAFAEPGNISAGAFRARDPYTWWWDGHTPTAYFPQDLNGKRCTVYYGVPMIHKSDGTFYTSSETPLQLLNLEFERILGTGSEYTYYPDQQVKQSWVSGLGSLLFDLGMSNAIPNLNFECIGAFTQWPNGDCDVADVIKDIAFSGPILVYGADLQTDGKGEQWPEPPVVVIVDPPGGTPTPVTATNLYVATTGSDTTGTGASGSPYRTIQFAVNAATAGTTIHVADGTYIENITIRNGGTSDNHVIIKSVTKWGAKIKGTGAQTYHLRTSPGADYVDIVDFEISNSDETGPLCGIAFYSAHCRAIGNHIHHLIAPNSGSHVPIVGIIAGAFSTQTAPTNTYCQAINNVIHHLYSLDPSAKDGCGITLEDQYCDAISNVVFYCNRYSIQTNHIAGYNKIVNNTVGYCPKDCGIMMSGGGDPGFYAITVDYIVVANNIVVDSISGIKAWDNGGGSTLGTHNTWTNNITFNNGANIDYGNVVEQTKQPADTSGIHADPLFVSKSYADNNTGDFHLQVGSPAINAASSTYAPTTDIDNRTRTGAPDIGAYEATGTAPPPTSLYSLYVSPTGNDSNSGSQSAPLATLTKAQTVAVAGTTIHVAPGTYTFSPTLTLSKSGTADKRIVWQSDVKHGAKIVSNGSTSDWDNAVNITASYIDFIDFDVYATNTTKLNVGILVAGSYNRIIGCKVHDIPAPGPEGVGGGGICLPTTSPITLNNQVLANHVYNIGDWQAPNPRVHGIYGADHTAYIANNIVHHCRSWGIHFAHAADACKVVNNTVYSNGYGGICIAVSTAENGGVKPDNFFIANNIVYHNGIGTGAQGYGIEEYNTSANLGPNCKYYNNLVYDNLPSNWDLAVTGGSGTGTVSQAPGFVNWQADGTGNYHLDSGSPCIDTGQALNAPTSDFDGVKRPVNITDIGAYEYQGSTTGASLYVATNGSDANNGAQSTPFKTIQKAANVANPGTTIYVADGVYSECVTISRSGTVNARIVFKSTNKWGAKVNGTSSSFRFKIADGTQYIDIVDFDIFGPQAGSGNAQYGVLIYGQHNRVMGCHIHDLYAYDTTNHASCIGIGFTFTGANGDPGPAREYNQAIANIIHHLWNKGNLNDPAGEGIYLQWSHCDAISNLVYACKRNCIQINHQSGYNNVINNTLGNCVFASGAGGGGTALMVAVGGTNEHVTVADYIIIANNMILDSTKGLQQWQSGGSTFGSHCVCTDNLYWGNQTNFDVSQPTSNKLTNAAAVVADPLVVSRLYNGSGDFHLQNGSPAINAGNDTYAPDTDIEGNPIVGVVDIGAYEKQ